MRLNRAEKKYTCRAPFSRLARCRSLAFASWQSSWLRDFCRASAAWWPPVQHRNYFCSCCEHVCTQSECYAPQAAMIGCGLGHDLTFAELNQPSVGSRCFEVGSPDALYMPWEDGWKSPGIRTGQTGRKRIPAVGGSAVLARVAPEATSSYTRSGFSTYSPGRSLNSP